MKTIAILGAGELGATLARILADREAAGQILLVDADEGRAKGKALDILQACPVEGSDTRVEGRSALDVECEAIVVTDATPIPPAKGLLVVAMAEGAPAVEAAVRRGWKRERVIGSAPIAHAAAFRRRLAEELRVDARDVSGLVLGLPFADAVVPAGTARAAGVPAEQLAPLAVRRALQALRERELGPVALAAAAARLLAALDSSRHAALPVFAALDGEYGHRRVALAVPARISCYGVEAVLEHALDPVDRVAFDTAAQRRHQAEV